MNETTNSLSGAAGGPVDFHATLDVLAQAAADWIPALARAFEEAFSPGPGGTWLALVVIGLAGIAGERIACWKLARLNQKLLGARAGSWSAALGFGALRVAFDIVGALLFYGFALGALYFTLDAGTPIYATSTGLLAAVLKFRVCLILVRAVLSPRAEGIRPLPLETADAGKLFDGVLVFAGAYIGLVFVWETVFARMSPPVLGRATGVLVGIGLAGLLVAMVWLNRARLEHLFRDREPHDSRAATLRLVFSQSWPYLFAVWVTMLWGNWAYALFTLDGQREKSALLSWWITLLFPAVDRLFHALLENVTHLGVLDRTGFGPRRERFIATVQASLRAILLGVALIAMAINWNLLGTDLVDSRLGAQVIWGATKIGLIVLVAYVLYEVVMAALEKHMPEVPDPDTPLEIEGEGGGAGATREETLAPLLRGVFLFFLGTIVLLTVLGALGVEIFPLIAGASIVGVAIGFGSQKLVQDVISGVFFLVDDAFRRGEYIDVGSVKGTVEKISIRSLQLRHHRGALHTIPFGEIRHLTNFSRDWVMMKLKLRLTYDTDVERVRKLIKKLGERLMDHPEIGEKFLQPLKSQGVYSMEDDSAMILRVKFMTRPGDQFVVRKQVYGAIRDLFEQEGIEFAHRVVKVQLDGKGAGSLTLEEQSRIAGAAALHSVVPGGERA